MKHVRFFGHPECVTMVVEEQSRKTLHAHFQIWIVGYREMHKKAFIWKLQRETEGNKFNGKIP